MEITLEWFFKVPGLFITGGFLLILIALLVFFVSAGKGKDNKEENLKIDIDKNDDRIILNQESSDTINENDQEAITFPKLEEDKKIEEPVAPQEASQEYTITDGLLENNRFNPQEAFSNNSFDIEHPKEEVQEIPVNSNHLENISSDIITPIEKNEQAFNSNVITPISFENYDNQTEINKNDVELNANMNTVSGEEIVFPNNDSRPIEIEPVSIFPTQQNNPTSSNTLNENKTQEEAIEEI